MRPCLRSEAIHRPVCTACRDLSTTLLVVSVGAVVCTKFEEGGTGINGWPRP